MPTPSPATSPLLQIHGWSSGSLNGGMQPWPDWQRDALRRIVASNSPLSPRDLDELEAICRGGNGIGPAKLAEPLTVTHLPTGPDAASSVTLTSLGKLENVNRVKGVPPLLFATVPGITIIYGDNGAGKSGYARVIKKACRARGAPPRIIADVRGGAPAAPARAEISFLIGSVLTSVTWTDGQPSDPRLANIFVFDSASAHSHVAEDGTTAFTPRGLEILPELAKACAELKARFKKESITISAEIAATRAGWKISADTQVGRFLSGPNLAIGNARIEELATFTETDRIRVLELDALLKTDPAIKGAQTRASAGRIRTFAALLEDRERQLSDEALSEIKNLMESAQAANAAARFAAGPAFDDTFLPGTGGDAWRRLWDLAGEYIATAYPGQRFISLQDAAQCPLCQQVLDSDAKRRFERFHGFVQNEARIRAELELKRLSDVAGNLSKSVEMNVHFSHVMADLADRATATVDRIKLRIQELDSRLEQVNAFLVQNRWGGLPSLGPSAVADIAAIVTAFDQRAELEKSAVDPVQRARLVSERDELLDRGWLAGNKRRVVDLIDKLLHVSRLMACEGECTTNLLTLRNGELFEALVKGPFCDQFKEECHELGLATMDVAMESAGGSKGERRFGIRVVGCQGHRVHEVASEGEQRCVALAAFLAELSLASHKSALVFDDPVSSLDHIHRAAVAARLTREAKTRQVIIFTHDAVFLHDLLEAADRLAVPLACRHVQWNGGAPGFCEEGLPWDSQRYTQRFDALEKEQRAIKREWNPQPNEANKMALRSAYSKFRSTIEKVLQDVIFNGVISRFRSYINVSPSALEPVVGFAKVECAEILRLHKRACDVTEAHDAATAKQGALPHPDELLKDIDALKDLVDAVKTRRKAPQPAATMPAPTSHANVVPVVITAPAAPSVVPRIASADATLNN